MDHNNPNLNSHSPIKDDDISMDVFDALLGLAHDQYHINRALPDDFEELDIASPYPIAAFYTYPDPPSFVEEGLPGDDWSQHFAPTTNHFQGHEDNGIMPSLEEVDGNIASVFNTIYHNSSPQHSPPGPLHTANSQGSQTIHSPAQTSNNSKDMPSPAPDTASRTPSPPNNEDRSPNGRGSRYNCTGCGTSSKTKRDHERHLTTKKHQKKTSNGSGSGSGSGSASPAPGFHCLAQDCEYSREGGKTFTREDNLWRHMKTVHYIKARA